MGGVAARVDRAVVPDCDGLLTGSGDAFQPVGAIQVDYLQFIGRGTYHQRAAFRGDQDLVAEESDGTQRASGVAVARCPIEQVAGSIKLAALAT